MPKELLEASRAADSEGMPEPVRDYGSVVTYSVFWGKRSGPRSGATQGFRSRSPLYPRVPITGTVEFRLSHLLREKFLRITIATTVILGRRGWSGQGRGGVRIIRRFRL